MTWADALGTIMEMVEERNALREMNARLQVDRDHLMCRVIDMQRQLDKLVDAIADKDNEK